MRATTPSHHWAIGTEYFYLINVAQKDHWLARYPENKFDNLYAARDFADEIGYAPYIKIYKSTDEGEIETERLCPYNTPGWKHDPKYRYIIQAFEMTDGYGVLLEDGGHWRGPICQDKTLKEAIHHALCYRGEHWYTLGEICRIIDTKEERVMTEYNDKPENDERRRQQAIRESPINKARHEKFLADHERWSRLNTKQCQQK